MCCNCQASSSFGPAREIRGPVFLYHQQGAVMSSVESMTAEEMFTTQDWSAYTSEQHEIWGILYDRRMAQLRDTARVKATGPPLARSVPAAGAMK